MLIPGRPLSRVGGKVQNYSLIKSQMFGVREDPHVRPLTRHRPSHLAELYSILLGVSEFPSCTLSPLPDTILKSGHFRDVGV